MSIGQYPLFPGSKRGGTSHAAAVAIATRARTLRDKALQVIKGSLQGATADEVAALLGESVLAIRPRVTELKELNMIVGTDQRRKNLSGRDAIVWRAA